MVWGQIAGAAVGGLLARDSAKRQASATDRATEASLRGYTDARPYITDVYSRGQQAYHDSLNAGAYGGPRYAGLTPEQQNALANLNNSGQRQFNDAYGNQMATNNYGANAANIYQNASGTPFGAAQAYAAQNAPGLVNAALRDSTRQLTEQTLPGINQGASATGNVNSSRAGVADAIAQRAYSDRAADVSANINNQLQNQYIGQHNANIGNQLNANSALASAYGNAVSFGERAAGNQLRAGTAYQGDAQARMDANRAGFEENRDFALNQSNKFASGVLGRAPMSSPTVQPNLVNSNTATMFGAMQGFGAVDWFKNRNNPNYQGFGFG